MYWRRINLLLCTNLSTWFDLMYRLPPTGEHLKLWMIIKVPGGTNIWHSFFSGSRPQYQPDTDILTYIRTHWSIQIAQDIICILKRVASLALKLKSVKCYSGEREKSLYSTNIVHHCNIWHTIHMPWYLFDTSLIPLWYLYTTEYFCIVFLIQMLMKYL